MFGDFGFTGKTLLHERGEEGADFGLSGAAALGDDVAGLELGFKPFAVAQVADRVGEPGVDFGASEVKI